MLTAEDVANIIGIGSVGDPDPRFADPTSSFFIDNGLYAVAGPEPGDIWAFEQGWITNDQGNFLPTWSEPMGGDPGRGSFSPWPSTGHGRLLFSSVPEPASFGPAILALLVLVIYGRRRL